MKVFMRLFRKIRGLRIRKKMAMLLLGSGFVFSLLVVLLLVPFFKWNLVTHLTAQQETLLRMVQGDIDGKLKLATNQLTNVAKIIPVDVVNDPAVAQSFLEDRIAIGALFDNGLLLLSPQGELIAETPRQLQRKVVDFSTFPFFRQVITAKETTISAPFRSTKDGHSVVVQVCAPVRDSAGQIVAVFSGGICLDGAVVAGVRNKIGANGYMYIYSYDRTILVHPDPSRVLQQDVPPGSNLLFDKALTGWDGTGYTVNSRGLETISSFKHLTMVPWVLGLNNPSDEALLPVKRAILIVIGVITLLSIVGMALVLLALRSVTMPLEKFSACLQQFDESPNSMRYLSVPESLAPEIRQLYDSFNSMLETQHEQQDNIVANAEMLQQRALELEREIVIRKQTEVELRKASRKCLATAVLLQTVCDNVPDLIWAKDLEHRYIFTNKANNDTLLFAKTADEPIGKTDDYFGQRILDNSTDKSNVYCFNKLCSQSDAAVLAGEQPMRFQECGYIYGKLICLDVYKAPLYNVDGELIGTVGSARVVTREKQLELETARLTRLYRILSEVNQYIVRAPQPVELFQFVCDTLLTSDIFSMAWVGVATEGEAYKPIVAAGFSLEDLMDSSGCIYPGGDEGKIITEIDDHNYQQQLCHAGQTLYRLQPFTAAGSFLIKPVGADSAVLVLYAVDSALLTHADELQLIHDLVGNVAFALDVARQEFLQVQALEQLELAAMVFASSIEGVVITDANEKIISVNRAFCEITGYSEDEVVGKTPRLIKSEHHERDFYQTLWNAVSETGQWQGEIWNRRKNGEVYPEHLSIRCIYNENGEVSRYIGVFSDQSQVKESEAQLEYLEWHDPLTGLPNRRMLCGQLEQSIALAMRENQRVALLCLDLDNFKDINDSFGFVSGDALLVQMAQRLRNRIKSSDIVARLGGDEFIVILQSVERQEWITTMAEELLLLMEQPFTLDSGENVRLTTSIGITVYPDHGDNTMELLKKVDSALYLSKQRGRDQFAYYSEEMTAKAVARVELSNCLRHALEHNELSVFYQPQVDLHSGNIVGAEALMRWNNNKLGMVSPDRFIPLAEELGCIVSMGEWILRTVCQQGKMWLDAGRSPLRLAVNISVVQFYHADIVHTVAQILAETGYPARYLELEVTESLLMHKEQETVTRLQELHRLGVTLAMDDFGTGYSSLSYLKYFPLHVLKIDKSFIDDLPHGDADRKMVTAIIQMGQGLGMKLLAEGVESDEQLDYLKEIGCDLFQGYHCSRPIPAEEFIALLDRG